jgi:hypothetical protein
MRQKPAYFSASRAPIRLVLKSPDPSVDLRLCVGQARDKPVKQNLFVHHRRNKSA